MEFIQKENNGNIFLKLIDGNLIPEEVYRDKCACGKECKCKCDCVFDVEVKNEEMIHEKHLPIVEKKDGKIFVKVGEVPHPMLDKHYIQFILVERETGFELKYLRPDDKPEALFDAEGAIAVYEYCNLHRTLESGDKVII